MTKDRSIRVFVSSTFRDMMAERDWLVKSIFPQLRKMCASRGVTWREVDLRWGIPDEDRDDVLSLCLEEINRCRPYFIGLLGERYGYIPEEITPDILERYPWLKTQSQKSITELEILYGNLIQSQFDNTAFFYFRDPGYLDQLPSGTRRAEFECESSLDAQKLNQLKQEIRVSAQNNNCCLREGYRDPQQLGEWILEDFSRVIDHEFPIDQLPDPLDQETGNQLSFANDLRRVYIQRPDAFSQLDAHILSNNTPLVVTGEPGVGKSALLANWYLQNTRPNSPGFSLLHFIGSTQESTDPINILRRIMLELKRTINKIEPNSLPEIPTEPETLRREFPKWIEKAAKVSQIVLIIDGLNHLMEETAEELGWLPEVFPSNCRVIISTTIGRSLDVLRRRGWPMMTIPPLSLLERKQMVIEFLAQYSRRLSVTHLEYIVNAEQTENPLFLKTMLEELRQFGEHERLRERIEYYLQAQTVTQLFSRLLQRMEEDYHPDLELARNSLSLIACSRYGLSETELLELLGSPNHPLPFRLWTPFSLAIEPFMLDNSGLLNFATPYFRQAVEQRYLPSDQLELQFHRRLAAYFELMPLPVNLESSQDRQDDVSFEKTSLPLQRVVEELPWQESKAKMWQSLTATLTLLPLFEVAYEKDSGLEWLKYWQTIEKAKKAGEIDWFDITNLYLNEFRSLEEIKKLELAGALGQFLKDAGFAEAAEECFAYERLQLADKKDDFLIAANLNDTAQVLAEQGKMEEAFSLYASAEKLLRQNIEKVENQRGLASVLMNRAKLAQDTGRNDEVESRLQESLKLMKLTTGEDSAEVATVLQSLGLHALNSGDTQQAFDLIKQAYEIRLKRLGPRHRDVGISMVNLGLILAKQGKIFRGIECLQKAIDILSETVGSEHSYTVQAKNSLEQLRKLES